MPNDGRIQEILDEMDANPHMAEALRSRILTRDLMQLPEALREHREQMANVMTAMTELFRGMNARLEAVETGIVELGTRVGAVETRLDTVETAIVELGTRVGTMETGIAELGTRMGAVETAIVELGTRVDGMETRLDARIDRMEVRVDARFDRMENAMSDIKGSYMEQKAIQEVEIMTADMDLRYIRTVPRGELVEMAGKIAAGTPLAPELRSFREADLIVEARDRDEVFQYVAAEVSFTADRRDIERALRNARILAETTGHPARAAIISSVNDEQAQAQVDDSSLFWRRIGE